MRRSFSRALSHSLDVPSRWLPVFHRCGLVCPAWGQAAHRFGVRLGQYGRGEFYDRTTSASILLRGNNYVRLAQQTPFYGGVTTYHSTFNEGLYDASLTESVLAEMQASGYSVVRVYLNGCCPGGVALDPQNGPASSAGYIANLADFLRRAKSHDIYVILTTDFAWGYDSLTGAACCAVFEGSSNLAYLTSGGSQASQFFWRDLINGLQAQQAPF